MRKIEIKHIKIDNFAGIKALDTEIYPMTLIKGKNKQGKSTIRNAVMWCLTEKMADGKSAASIRPHDNNGVDVDFVDIVVEITLLVDGREIVIKKTQKQDWVKDRSTQEQTFKGNVNEYEVNGIPKKEKDFKAYLEENVASVETLLFCLTPFSFLALDTKKRRAKLFELVSDFSNNDVIATDLKFNSLENELKDGTLDELIARSKKAISKFKETLKELPARIDEVAKQIVDMDFAELELQKNDLERQIKEIEDKQNADSKTSDLGQKIMELKFNLNGIATNLNDALIKQKSEIDNVIYELVRGNRSIDMEITEKEDLLKRRQEELKSLNDKVKDFEGRLDMETTSVFDENSLICPNCKQEYPSDKKDEIKGEFERRKLQSISNLQLEISGTLEKQKSIKAEIELIENSLNNLRSTKASTEQNIKLQEENLAKLPQTVDVSQNAEYQKLANQIDDMEKQLEDLESKERERKEVLKAEESRLRSELSEVNAKLLQKDTNIKAEDRIAELKAEQRKVSQKIADEERQLDLLEEFNRTKVGMITEKVNSYFDVIKWQMFKAQVNGGYAEVCYPIVNGTSYDGLLNHGDKILAEVDICKAFQKANDIECAIFMDDTESVDADRLPKLDSQLIVLRREDCDLKIEESEE